MNFLSDSKPAILFFKTAGFNRSPTPRGPELPHFGAYGLWVKSQSKRRPLLRCISGRKILCYPRVTQLDMTGPYELLARMPNIKIHVLWKDKSLTDVGRLSE